MRYGAEDYSIGGRDLADVQAEITAGVADGGIYWLNVNEGLGLEKPASLAISNGTPVALTPISGE